MNLDSIFGGGGGSGSSGWTLATILVFGIVIVLFLGFIVNFLGFGIGYALNVSETVNEEFYKAVGEAPPEPVATVDLGNYSGQVPRVKDPVFASMIESILPLLFAVSKLLTTPEYFAIVVAISMIIVGIELKGR